VFLNVIIAGLVCSQCCKGATLYLSVVNHQPRDTRPHPRSPESLLKLDSIGRLFYNDVNEYGKWMVCARACTCLHARMFLIIIYVSSSLWVVCVLIIQMNYHFLPHILIYSSCYRAQFTENIVYVWVTSCIVQVIKFRHLCREDNNNLCAIGSFEFVRLCCR